jgi:hypothetical protein
MLGLPRDHTRAMVRPDPGLEGVVQMPSRIDSLVPPRGVLDRGAEADGTLRTRRYWRVPEERGRVADSCASGLGFITSDGRQFE